jgi:Taurine catabolism dioxygenase TauD, TfdA family
MTEEQAESIDTIQFTAGRNQLAIKLEAGDIEVFNNLALFHARNGVMDRTESEVCVNDSETAKRTLNGTRHMLRLWLRSADEDLMWETPEPLKKNSYEIYGDSEYRKIGKWDVHRAPPINRVLTKHFKCS